jgi:hypothetical protein
MRETAENNEKTMIPTMAIETMVKSRREQR